ncbi:MAG: PLP-dependent aspartate aminotransferase family protein [Ilumatobacteraceae bacterium]
MSDRQQPATQAITAGRSQSRGSLAPALWASTAWESDDLADANRRATSIRAGEFYSRYSNPTVRSFEEAIAALEGADDALAFASGMGAIATVIFGLCSSGDHLVAQRQLYAGTLAFLQGPCQRMGIEITLVDGTEPGAFAAAVRPGKTMLVLAETPSNPRLELVDLDELGSLRGPITVVDSTFATPLGQQPLAHGVHLSLHSATKGIAGLNDATLGVVAGEQELIDAIWAYSVLHGATASPYDALNAIRGIRTLAVRTTHQAATALRIAEVLVEEPAVAAVHYPGLVSHPQFDLAKRQMRHGGTVLAIELAGGRQAAERFIDSLQLARVATSLGGPETLVCHPATSTHASLTPAEAVAMGISEGLLRISIGLEDTSDLVSDLTNALHR